MNNSVIIEKQNIEESFEYIKALFIEENATFKKWDFDTGEYEVRFRYGLNAFGMRIRLLLSEYDANNYALEIKGDFVDAIDTFGSAKQKAIELTERISQGLEQKYNSALLETEDAPKDIQFGSLLNYGFFKWF